MQVRCWDGAHVDGPEVVGGHGESVCAVQAVCVSVYTQNGVRLFFFFYYIPGLSHFTVGVSI